MLYFRRPHIKEIFQSIAAKVGTGEPCCDWVSICYHYAFTHTPHTPSECFNVLVGWR